MCDIANRSRQVVPGARSERIRDLEAEGFQVVDFSTLRAPDPEYVESVDQFLHSIQTNPLTPDEVLGTAASFFFDEETGDT